MPLNAYSERSYKKYEYYLYDQDIVERLIKLCPDHRFYLRVCSDLYSDAYTFKASELSVAVYFKAKDKECWKVFEKFGFDPDESSDSDTFDLDEQDLAWLKMHTTSADELLRKLQLLMSDTQKYIEEWKTVVQK